jgi:hypothetical protein
MPGSCSIIPALVLALTASLAVAADGAAMPSPAQLYDQVMSNRELKSTTGEQFTWHAAYRGSSFLDAYEATGSGDPAWLEQAQRFYDWCITTGVSNDPDGCPGTIGADIGEDVAKPETDTVADTLVGDANIALPLVHFAELVKANPALKERFGRRADEYVDLAVRMCWDKWNARGCYYQDGHGYGSYHTHPRAIAKDDRTKWVERPNHLISDNLNKHYKASLVLLGLYRLTGKAEYRDRVVALYDRAKAMFRLLPDEDRLVWNYWMPHGPYDIDGTAPKSWVGVHPHRPGYQAFEAEAFVEVYDAGLVFERSDIERIVRTNRWMLANGLQSADGTSKAGTVWGGLARFDDTIRAAYEQSVGKDAIALAFLRNVTMKRPGYDRHGVADQAAVKIPAIAVQPGRRLSMAYPIPDVIETANQDRVRLVTRATEAGALSIELLSADGKTVLGPVFSGAIDANFAAPRWDGTNPKTGTRDPGEYLLRWTLNGESRTWPITVKVGIAHPKAEAPAPLAAGGSLAYDFETPLEDGRWKLEGGAAIAGDRAKGGKLALRLGRRQGATLAFGDQSDLRVRISFSAFDGGAKHGKKNANGPALAVRNAAGDLFAMRQAWRGYLNGDGDLAWFNTGENQWFSPHPSGIGRVGDWSRWTFDFTAGGPVAIDRDGKRVASERLAPAQWVPTGAVGLVFIGPEEVGDPELWIDDVTVELPAAKP